MDRNPRRKKFVVYMKRSSKAQLQNGMQGMLLSYQMHESNCVQDVHNIFAEFNYFEHLSTAAVAERNAQQASASDDLNVAVESLKRQEKDTFEIIPIGIKNMLFVAVKKATGIDTKSAVYEIIDRIVSQKQRISKFILKMLPIEQIVRADIANICDTFRTQFLPKYFTSRIASNPDATVTFAIVCNLRFNGSLDKDTLIDELANVILEQNRSEQIPFFKVNLSEPDLCVIVEVVKNHCLLSVLPDYYKFKKFNLNELMIANCFKDLTD